MIDSLDFEQPKPMRKLVQQAFKQFAQRSLDDCIFKFFELLSKIWRFDVEKFPCSLGVSSYVFHVAKMFSFIN